MISLLSGHPRSFAGFVDVNFYPELTEVNTDSVLTVNVFSKLPGRFQYFSLTNVINTDRSTELSGEVDLYTEQNLRWQVAKDSPFDLTVQLNFRSGRENDRHRLGARWRFDDTPVLTPFFDALNLSYSINFHLIQFDHEAADVWQMEHVVRKTFPGISDRLYLAGFVDHTFGQDLPAGYPSAPIVAEFQLGCRLVDQFHLIAEYRINEYRRTDTRNLAIGLQYIAKW
ncbi:hypothetical protein [Pelagicoccus sp. SDUM812003]|uniref:hypothetical protein n=1 Tax=Pelagicoccus sp. SDUM812003 TaxID=3041267 RepID=UPI002810C707|nr:hypothetical protein [Pelagicoccus sp. SDUM812003]